MNTRRHIAVLGLLTLASTSVATQPDSTRERTVQSHYELQRWTVDSGGGTALNGALRLDATIGQPEPGSMIGGTLEMEAGFWFGSGAKPGGNGGGIFKDGFEGP